MDQLHRRLAHLALAKAGAFGFCLAGGYAVQVHGFLDRPSEDVDLFTTTASEEHFSDALAAVIRAYEADGLDVAMTMANPGFARLQVTDPTTGTTAKVELGIDWRANPPVALAIGPVLHPDDAVANKVCALYSRAQARDFIDVDAIRRSGRYTGDELLARAKEHDPGFDLLPTTRHHRQRVVERTRPSVGQFSATRVVSAQVPPRAHAQAPERIDGSFVAVVDHLEAQAVVDFAHPVGVRPVQGRAHIAE
jgi:Nucleotidyl transferase AbiEii toxin, Type IV TA system